MKKYIFSVKRAIKSETKIVAKNKSEAIKKLFDLLEKEKDKAFENIDIETEILKFHLEKIVDSRDGKTQENNEELVQLIEELEEYSGDDG